MSEHLSSKERKLPAWAGLLCKVRTWLGNIWVDLSSNLDLPDSLELPGHSSLLKAGLSLCLEMTWSPGP